MTSVCQAGSGSSRIADANNQHFGMGAPCGSGRVMRTSECHSGVMETTRKHILKGQVAVITGGASGMGLATAQRFVAEGASVVLADLNEGAGREAADALGENARFERCDVSIEADVAAAIEVATDTFGRLDVMFNNAGVGGAFGPVTEIGVDDWDATFDVLVKGVFVGTKHAARQMIARGAGGSIINTASVAGLSGGGGPQAYSAAKAAVINLTASTAIELAPHSIRVNAICPGIIFTPLMHRGAEDEAEAVMRELQPWPHRGEGSDIAGTALWLAGPDSAFVTGSSIVVDGGINAAGTRLYGKLGGTEHLDSITGIAHGTTGRPATVRRL